jgi:hypothetical protein
LAATWLFIGCVVAPGAAGNWLAPLVVGGGNVFCETGGVGVAGKGCGSGSSSLLKRELWQPATANVTRHTATRPVLETVIAILRGRHSCAASNVRLLVHGT